MTTNDHSTSPDEQKITQLYQTGATEQPSSLLDQKILNQAKAALPGVKPSTNSEQAIRPKTWRKWQWSGSIAASVLRVSWLFMFNQRYNQGADLVVEEQYIESKVAAKAQSEDATRSRRMQTKQELQIVARSEKNADDSVHRASAEKVENKSRNGLPMSDELASFVTEEKDIAEADAIIADIGLSTPVPKNLATEKSAEIISSLAQNTDNSSADYQQLDKLLQKVLFYGQKMDSKQSRQNVAQPPTSEQTSVQAENENSTSAKNTQAELFELLFKYKQSDPMWSVPQRYLNVLNQDQLRELATLSDVELHE